MPELRKGENTAVDSGRVTAELHTVGDPVDLSALLVAAGGTTCRLPVTGGRQR